MIYALHDVFILWLDSVKGNKRQLLLNTHKNQNLQKQN